MSSTTPTVGGTARRAHLVNALPWLWLGLTAAWAVVVFATDQPAWPLALWIATTVGPVTARSWTTTPIRDVGPGRAPDLSR